MATTEDGRLVSPPTVEFRLSDGSAHPELLLAGIAQAMTRGRGFEDLDARLEATTAVRARTGEAAVPLPRSRRDIAEALAATRDVLEAGDVFPPLLLDEVLKRLEA